MSNEKNKIGIIGYGFVGGAVGSAYHINDLRISDVKYEPEDTCSVKDLVKECEAIFVCVPTPEADTGECDTSILESVLTELTELKYQGLVICKSTATPTWYINAEKQYPLKLAHVPEFLTQKNAVWEYQHQNSIVIGTKFEYLEKVFEIVVTRSMLNIDPLSVESCSIGEAAMLKYISNTSLAMKVIINNEFYKLCSAVGIDYSRVAEMASHDRRLGNSHWQVPGQDGNMGFGGACFPKDTRALISLAESLNVDMIMLRTARVLNRQFRS